MTVRRDNAVRIAEQIHYEAKIQATRLGITLREYVEHALITYNLRLSDEALLIDKED